MLPLISVYIPTHNRSQSLRAAVESVQKQTWSNLEVIVVDDGSSDATPEMMADLSRLDGRVKYIRNDKSAGACAARNAGIRAASGEFITGLDDDDEFMPQHLELLHDAWVLMLRTGERPSCLFVQYLLRNDGKLTQGCKRGAVLAEEMFDKNHVGNQVFAPTSHFREAGYFDEAMPAWQDLEFFYRILKMFGPARLLDIPSYVFDVTPRGDRISHKQKSKITDACNKMNARHGNGLARRHQRLLLQKFSGYYGFRASPLDFFEFCMLGFWPRGYLLMFFRLFSIKLED